jgi:predicted short-subunit dehydrogenase-like oxidoreductase (DUF2520 family)
MSYKITIIGSGNVAWHLSQALEDAGHSIREIYSRNISNARKLCGKLYDASPTDNLDFTQSEADIFLVCIPDDALEQALTDLRIPEDAIIAHTSGTKPIDVFDLLFFHKGVFYPLQTFSKQRSVSFKNVPVCIEASNEDTENILTDLAKSITREIYYFDSEKRKVLHIAAVFACNFTNHLMAISKQICDKEEIDFTILDPLISETINKALENDPAEMQTGPAIRKDVKIIHQHLDYLKDDDNKKQIYRILSESILKMSREKN